MSSAKSSGVMVSPFRSLASSRTSALCLSLTAKIPRRLEAWLIFRHSLTCYPAFSCDVKYSCILRAGATKPWCARFRTTVSRYDQYAQTTEGCWWFLTMTASVTFYTRGAVNVYQLQNSGSALVLHAWRTAHLIKAQRIWSCYKTSRRWTD